MKPSVRRELVDYAVNTHTVSLRHACKVVGISDSVYRYKPDSQSDEDVIVALQGSSLSGVWL
ncbi:ISxcC1 transposase [Legionella birminghamensis]|uniref:ISxcC1 transposase n=1 Tax=Legionella birminghamensis TaxID=28083 RepID=A0ABR5QIW6_9GAMM|nr:ISxcC1 transposase [Legionella birminghamensis]